ncbi:hypothetical protein POM88_015345 [Heracleum sosnowskyi]|uniref:Uncharacterized protein n=1 Tax=Heracleum sosnowskyi TaxID=360622 RepID=A0AAD8MW75_9APIA|nr:hypothetical protein POM88_015345 [Heracleum sosnowskyi]
MQIDQVQEKKQIDSSIYQSKDKNLQLCLDKTAVILDHENRTGIYIWAIGVSSLTINAQMLVMFVEQGLMTDIDIGSYDIPAVFLLSLGVISVIVQVLACMICSLSLLQVNSLATGRGFSELQSWKSAFYISVAALVEIKRIQLARNLT